MGASKSTQKSALETQNEALAQARKTGKPVNVSAAETPTSTLTANPSGSFVLRVNAQPVRKLVRGRWQRLDATLRKNANGTVSPALTSSPLILSGGGTAPLATMRSGAYALGLTLPVRLPAPVLAGDTATYHSVLPGIDLVVTATPEGGFSDVYVIHSAAAAASPRLASLLTARVTTDGLTVGVGKHDDISAKNVRGQVIFGAAAPRLWDSAADGAAANGAAARSSLLAPGPHAHHGTLSARLAGHTLTLIPDPAVLRGPATAYPVFADPTWTGGKASWSTPSENYPGDPHWNSSAESAGLMQVGMADTGFWADTLINFNLPLGELGSEGTSNDIQSATFTITNVGANNCTAQTVDVYAPSATLLDTLGNPTWNNWFTSSRSLGGPVGWASFANGWSSSCPARSVGFGLSTTWIQNDVNTGKAVQTLALAGTSYSAEKFTGNGAGQNAYEVFDPASPALQITFIHAPATPTGLYTSPNSSTVGKGDVTLYAPVSDPDGGTLTVTFNAYVTGHPGEVIKSATAQAGSGTTAPLLIPEATLDGDVTSAAYGGTPTSTTLGVSWYVSVTNGTQTATSAVQNFMYDISTPGAPDIYLDSQHTTPCTGTPNAGFSYTVGTPASFYFAPASGQNPATSYSYQLNDTEPVTVPASSGNATATITPTAQTDILTVSALNAAGNVGQPQSCVITARVPANASDGDLNNDGNADLLVPGAGTTTLPAGLWLAPGTGGGKISADAANIGLKGTGVSITQSPAQWTGTQVVTGLFQGAGFNDVLDYNPSLNGTAGCSGNLLATYGQSLPLNPLSGGQTDVLAPTFTYYVYDAADGQYDQPVCATSVATGGNLNLAENGASAVVTSYSPSFPDLLVVDNGSLFLEPEDNSVGNWAGLGTTDPNGAIGAIDLSDVNPTGGGTWANWTISTLLVNGIPAMFAVSPSGAVYYYSPTAMADLAYQVINSATLSGAAGPVEVATGGLGATSYTRIQAVSLGGGTLGLWAVSNSGAVTDYQLNSAGTTLTALGPATTLVTASHDWALNDQASGTVGTAADAAGNGGMSLTGNGGASWSSKDANFAPDVVLNGTNGNLSAAGHAVDLTGSFTVSAWINPTATGQVLLSQDGGQYAGFTVGTTGTAWTFGLNKGPGSASTFDTITGGTVQLGQWSQITASYDKGTGIMDLYVDGVYVATAVHSAPSAGATGPFRIGSAIDGGRQQHFFAGQVAQAQAWNQALAPIAASSLASYHYSMAPTRFMDTRTGMGGTTGPIAPNTVTKLRIAGTDGIPATGVTAVAIDLTVTDSTSFGNVLVYPDGDQMPITSSANFDAAGSTVTNYLVVPVGPGGQIDLNVQSPGTAQLIVDVTGYFDTLYAAGAQTYHPLAAATRVLDTGTGLGASGMLAAGSTLTLQIAQSGSSNPASAILPSNAAAVAISLTATDATNDGYLEVYANGAAAPPYDTALTYLRNNTASLDGDVPIGAGGKIVIANESGLGASTYVVGDVAGYYTNDLSGDVYHSTNPTRLVDTRIGIGGITGAIAANGTYSLSGPDVQNISTAAQPVLELNVTVTGPTGNGLMIVYPSGSSVPATSNLNWGINQAIANSAIVPAGAGDVISFLNDSPSGSTQLVVDCSGFFAAS